MDAVAQPADWPETILPRCRREIGSLGSKVVALQGGSARMLKAAIEEPADGFRKSWYDLAGGIAVFMAPNLAHAFTARDTIDVVKALCHAKSLAVVVMGDTTIKADQGGKGIEPDESFLVGERAAGFLRIEAGRSLEAALEDLGEQPPDLVVEVEHTHYDPDKIAIYRAAGVPELWELATGAARRVPRILDLQAGGDACPVATSRILPGVRATALPAAAAELRKIGGLMGFMMAAGSGEPVARRLLAAAGVSKRSEVGR